MEINETSTKTTITTDVHTNVAPLMESIEEFIPEDGKAVIKCPKCDYTSDKVTNCRRHFDTMHTILKNPELCCGKSFQTKGDYREHRKSCHPGGLYFCHLCPAEPVKRKALLVRHMSIHTGIKQHVCKLCGYASPNKFNVKRHMVTHSVTSTNPNKSKDLQTETSQEPTPLTMMAETRNSMLMHTPLLCSTVLPDSTTDSTTNGSSANPILRGILHGHEESCGTVTVHQSNKSIIRHSIEDILSRDCRMDPRVAELRSISSNFYYHDQPRFPDNQEHQQVSASAAAGGINNSEMRGENWSGIDELYNTKGYSYNWSHVSAHGSALSAALRPFPYEVPLYYNNYTYNYLPPSAYNPSFTTSPFSECFQSGVNNAAAVASMYFQPEKSLLSSSPYGGIAYESAFVSQLKNVVGEHKYNEGCHEDHSSQAVLINQQDSRFVPGLAFWDFKDSSGGCLAPFDYGGGVGGGGGVKQQSGSGGKGLGFRPPVVSPLSITGDRLVCCENKEGGLHEHNCKDTESGGSVKISENSGCKDENEVIMDDEHSPVEYIPKKLRLAKKFSPADYNM